MNASRNCSRCGKELTDAASMEVGVGPICRKMDNYILATCIPADVAAARKALYTIEMDRGQDLLTPTYLQIEADLSDASNTDWRATVKRVEWILSHNLSYKDRVTYKAIVSALGYTALVNMWNGEAAHGKATVRYEAGRLYLKGVRCKAGIVAIKTIKGRTWNPTAKEWSVPVSVANIPAFSAVVSAHWPNHDVAEAAAAYAEAAAFGAAQVAQEPAQDTPAKAAYEVGQDENSAGMWVRTPYDPYFIAALKSAIPYKARSWDKVAKVWRFDAAFLGIVQGLLGAHFAAKVAA